METEAADSGVPKQLKGRKKKKLFLKIKEQMEFYFSDSNLARDKFLQNLFENNPDGYVDLEVFKSFNKIKELTEDIDIIAAAVSKSDILQLNSEKTKIKRVTPLGGPKDIDACILYVEKLPPYADHKWIKDAFQQFGKVDYVNIPRFKVSNKSKGFAFVEFNDPESVGKACQFYKNSTEKKKIESEGQPTDKKLDAGKTKKAVDNPEKKSRKRKLSSDGDLSPKKIVDNAAVTATCDKSHEKSAETSGNDLKMKQSRKRKLESNDHEKPPKKKKEFSAPVTEHQPQKSDSEQKNPAHSEQQPASATENQSAEEGINNSEDEAVGKSKRKRKRKKNHNQSEKPILRVMSKHEWKNYRNKYLTLQRTTMSLVKKQILLETRELKEQELANSKTESDTTKKGLEFQPGVIIKISLKDSIIEPSDIKEQVKTAVHVAYIEAQLGHSEMFLRCHNPEEALSIVQEEKLSDFGELKILEGEEEKAYWKKIEEDRNLKYSTPVVKKKRGRDKIIAKAAKLAEQKNKHIYFDE